MYPSGKKNIIITGGAGFLGSHLCDLLAKDNNVICLDSFIGGNIYNIDQLLQNPNFRFIKHDINQPIDLENISELKEFKIKFQGIQEIYHLACPTSAKKFMELRLETLWANSIGTINVLEIAKKYKSKLLFTSSAVIYGARHSDNPYFKETDFGTVNCTSPRACYDEGKRFSETVIATYKEMYKFDAKIVRIFRTYGPRMPLFDGQMVADFVLQALNNKPLIIYGDDSFSSSFCYVGDVIQAMTLMMGSAESGPFNIGAPDVYKMSDLANKIIKLTNSSSEVIFKDPILFMTPMGLPDITLAKNKIGWFPLVSLDDGLKKTVEHIKVRRMMLDPFLGYYEKE